MSHKMEMGKIETKANEKKIPIKIFVNRLTYKFKPSDNQNNLKAKEISGIYFVIFFAL